ncbi:MAG: lipoprotein [Flavobacteriales bacterium]
MKKVIFYLSTLFILASCASSRFVEPLKKGEQVVALDVGGPTIEFGGAVIPIPLSSIVYARGIDTNLTVFGSVHVTSLLFGNIQTDLGATYRFFESKKSFLPSLSTSVNGNAIYDMNDSKFKFWPQLDLNAYWNFGEKDHYVYAGVSNWWELADVRSQERAQLDRWLVNPQIGLVIKTNKWFYSLETKFLGPSHNNVNLFVPYFSLLGEKGASAIYFGIGRKF